MSALLPLAQLRGPRVRLRPFGAADRHALLRLHADPRALRYWSHGPWTDVAQADALLRRDAEGAASGVRLAVEHQGTVVGSVSLFAWSESNRRAELGYLLDPTWWGRGLAREAVTLALDHVFGTVGAHRMEADTDPRNTGSVRLLEALGFRREGLLRERWIVEGEVSDSALYGLLAREWTARRAPTAP